MHTVCLSLSLSLSLSHPPPTHTPPLSQSLNSSLNPPLTPSTAISVLQLRWRLARAWKIGAAVRKAIARSAGEELQRTIAATKLLQRVRRGQLARNEARRLRLRPITATMLQAAFRGYRTRNLDSSVRDFLEAARERASADRAARVAAVASKYRLQLDKLQLLNVLKPGPAQLRRRFMRRGAAYRLQRWWRSFLMRKQLRRTVWRWKASRLRASLIIFRTWSRYKARHRFGSWLAELIISDAIREIDDQADEGIDW